MDSSQLRKALWNADFPATKEELVQAAQAAGAPAEVLRALRAIPPDVYANRDEVARSLPADPAASRRLSEAQRAAAARESRHHGGEHLSQYEREIPRPVVEDELDT